MRPADLLRDLLRGPAPAWPPAVDRLAEAWAGAAPRVRLAVVALALLVVAAVAGRGAARSPWGPATTVVLATRDLPVGHVVTADDVRDRAWPRAIVPDGASGALDAVVGRRLSVGVVAGTPVTSGHLGALGVAAELRAGTVAVPVTTNLAGGVTGGQRVDLLAGDGAGRGIPLAADALVLSVDGDVLWVAVTPDEATALAGVAEWGRVTVALRPS